MASEDIKWFPLDRIEELERQLSDLVHSAKSRRDGIGMMLGLNGLRVSEVCWALAKHFQPLNRSLYVCPCDPDLRKNPNQVCKPLKHGVARTIKLDQSLIEAIVSYRATITNKQSKWLLPNRSGESIKSQLLSAKARTVLVQLGMMDDPSTRFHMFRHTCAMRILAETNDVLLVKKHLGHSNVQTTLAYVDCLKEVPTACLAKLYKAPKMTLEMERQLNLFDPFPEGEAIEQTAAVAG